jgi:uncharacterized protein YkwD
MNKQNIRQTILGLLTLFSMYLYAIENNPRSETMRVKKTALIDISLEEKRTMYYLNTLRKEAGLIPLNQNSLLESSAKNHANYLVLNHRIGHYEDENKTGYTGKYGSHRSVNMGYKTSMIIENVSSNNRNHKESVEGLMAAIYHRFGFLDFHIDEIGIGVAQNLDNRAETAFVYDMGSQKLERLCIASENKKVLKPFENICSSSNSHISKSSFIDAIHAHRYQNAKFVVYPYDNQEDVPPVFYEELPDPLPNHSVSGFPISMSFNEIQFKSVKVVSFQLFDANGEEIRDTVFYNYKTDPNKKLKKYEFALFPLQRLNWNSLYNVRVAYEADGIIKRKSWSFKTRSFDIPVTTVTQNKNHYTIKKGESAIFYFPPRSSNDILGNLRFPSILDISFVDKNTIKLKALEVFEGTMLLTFGKHQLKLNAIL